MYLPQFHRIPENDEWWGNGYTEWVSVKKATPLFDGHDMPRVPLNENYYNLLNKDTMAWQSKLMQDYGIYGMCFYHYYFKNGKKILEKPAENLLEWKDINMPFCFSWANEPWARSWSKLRQKNVWSLENDNADSDSDGILLEQNYGNIEEWKEHFLYLLPFFKDNRYIKIDGRPVFLIYKSDDIYCLPDMLDVWKKLALDNNIKPLYVISTNNRDSSCDAQVNMEPQYSFRRFYPDKYKNDKNTIASIIDYKDIIEKSIGLQLSSLQKERYLSVFPSYDDTPRRSNAGIAVIGSSPELFRKYVSTIIQASSDVGNSFMFINAWNEWGETMYLEPDSYYKEKYLEAFNSGIKEKPSGYINSNKNAVSNVEELEKTIDQYRSYWKIFESWLTLKEKNKSIVDYLKLRSIDAIAVYGLGMIGNHLLTELENSSIKIEFGIDGKGSAIKEKFPVYTLEDKIPEIQLVIVTVTYDYITIREKLIKKGVKNIISLEKIIGELIE